MDESVSPTINRPIIDIGVPSNGVASTPSSTADSLENENNQFEDKSSNTEYQQQSVSRKPAEFFSKKFDGKK